MREQQKTQEASRLQEALNNLLKQAEETKKEEVSIFVFNKMGKVFTKSKHRMRRLLTILKSCYLPLAYQMW